jgi:hypothetical protein
MREVTIPQLWQLLNNPTHDLVSGCRYESTGIVVRDESWKQLRLGVEAVKSFDAD